MELVLMRHGIALDLNEMQTVETPKARARDADRPLSDEGRRKVREVAKALPKLGVRPEVVLHSGFARARETAELVAARVRPHRRELVTTEALEPDADARLLFEVVKRLRANRVLAVGHAPNLDCVIASACGADGRCFTALGKAGAACLELPDSGRGPARLVWLLTPKLLRKL